MGGRGREVGGAGKGEMEEEEGKGLEKRRGMGGRWVSILKRQGGKKVQDLSMLKHINTENRLVVARHAGREGEWV